MDMHSRMSSLPTRSNAPHSSRRLSSNSSLSSLSELGMLEQQQRPHERPSSSSSVKTVSSSPSSTNGNMMKKLGSRFMLKRKDTAAAAAASHDNAIEELLDNDDDEEDSQILATARPRAGRILTSSNASTAGRTSIYGDLNNVCSTWFTCDIAAVNKPVLKYPLPFSYLEWKCKQAETQVKLV